MFDFLGNLTTGSLFGKVAAGCCRISMNGGIAVKCNSGSGTSYKSYNLETKRLTNCTNFCLNLGDEFFFVMPTNKVKVGDVIMVNNKPKCVVEEFNHSSGSIKVIDYENAEIRDIVPERHVFMNNTYLYGKIISPFQSFIKGKKKGGLMQMFFKYSMLSSFLGGNKGTVESSENPFGQGAFGNIMMMNMLNGGGGLFSGEGFDLFGGMFDELEFDTEIPENILSSITGDALTNLSREDLKRYITKHNLDVKPKKSWSDDELRAAIRSAESLEDIEPVEEED